MVDLVDPGRGCVWVKNGDGTQVILAPLHAVSVDRSFGGRWWVRHGSWGIEVTTAEAQRVAGLVAAYWDRRAGPDGLGDRGA